MFNKKRAFTLAEVLIALAIIGVVAALTVPRVMSDTQAKTTRLKVQKAFTTLTNALAIGESKLDYNMADIEDLLGTGADSYTLEKFITKTMNVTRTNDLTYVFAGKAITGSDSGTLSIANYNASTFTASVTAVFKAQDGVYYIFPPLSERSDANNMNTYGCTKTTLCVGYIDINGPEGPNELITCTSGADAYPSYDTTNKVMNRPAECSVDKSALTDIYPFLFYNGEAIPAVNAFDTVLTTEVKD